MNHGMPFLALGGVGNMTTAPVGMLTKPQANPNNPLLMLKNDGSSA